MEPQFALKEERIQGSNGLTLFLKEAVMADIKSWIAARVPAVGDRAATA